MSSDKNAAPLRILGIDPGLKTTGFGVIEKQGARLSYVASGTIHTQVHADLPDRLKIILSSVTEIIGTYRPDCAAVEKVFVNVNPQSTLLLGQARGAAICALVSADLAISEYTALQVKQAVVGHGKAQKKQVQEMVKRLLFLPAPPKSDAADALGVAICHANTFDAMHAIQEAASLKRKSAFRIRRGRLIR